MVCIISFHVCIWLSEFSLSVGFACIVFNISNHLCKEQGRSPRRRRAVLAYVGDDVMMRFCKPDSENQKPYMKGDRPLCPPKRGVPLGEPMAKGDSHSSLFFPVLKLHRSFKGKSAWRGMRYASGGRKEWYTKAKKSDMICLNLKSETRIRHERFILILRLWRNGYRL